MSNTCHDNGDKRKEGRTEEIHMRTLLQQYGMSIVRCNLYVDRPHRPKLDCLDSASSRWGVGLPSPGSLPTSCVLLIFLT